MTLTTPTVRIEYFDPRSGSAEGFAAFNAFSDVMRAEQFPDDPPMPHADRERWWRNLPAYDEPHMWLAFDGDRVVGASHIIVEQHDTNRHALDFRVEVLPEYRRRGLGRELFRRVVTAAREHGRTLLIGFSSSRVPAAGAALEAVGAKPGLPMLTSQLDLVELDDALLSTWIQRAGERAADFDLGFWSAYPEEHLEAFAHLVQVMNTAPRGELDIEDHRVTPQELRQTEAWLRKAGMQRVTAYVTQRSTGRFAGFTELAWRENIPTIVHQWGTGVLPEFRAHGLGRWLKAAMLKRLKEVNPHARFVRTGNANVNEPMLNINRALGFRPYTQETIWQLELEQAQAYLDRA